EALRALGVEQTVSWIGGSQLIKACAERTGLPTLNVGRALAPQLFDYNREGAWNGHIPVTTEVNHQWSKGWAFESAFGDYVEKHVAADLHYYSLLRPLSELA